MLKVSFPKGASFFMETPKPVLFQGRIATDFISDYLHETGEVYEFPFMERYLDVWFDKTDPNGYAIDVGANLGIWTLLFSSLYAKVLSIEPLPKMVSCLESSIKSNNIINTDVYPFALSGEQKGTCWTFSPAYAPTAKNRYVINWGASNQGSWDVSELSSGVTTGKANDLRVPSGMKCSVIKADVEGNEEDVLTELKSVIKSDSPILLIEQHDIHAIQKTLAIVSPLGYCLVDQMWFEGSPLSVFQKR